MSTSENGQFKGGKLNGLDLFSGIGGLTKALEGYVTPIAYCENDRYAQSVLLSRMSNGGLPIAPVWDDVKTLRGEILPFPIDIIYGGFPCQDVSVAGRGAGLEGERSGLFFEIARLIGEIRPRFVFMENVSGITVRGAERITGELDCRGYDTRFAVIRARKVGHQRRRWFLLAHAKSVGQIFSVDAKSESINQQRSNASFSFKGMASITKEGFDKEISAAKFVRKSNGIPYRMDRINTLGNAVVPSCAREAFERLMGFQE